jgi:type IV pilus assembly protein PilM
MALFGRKRTTVGLDIGSGLVKVAVVDHSRGTPELARVAISPLPADAIVEGEVMDPGLVAEAIRKALHSVAGDVKEVVTAVGGRDVIIKRIQTERVKEQQARELMQWEAEQHVPDVESVELDFQILDPEGAAGDDMSVLLVAAKRDLIEAKLRILAEAGVHASIVDVDAFALHNAFELNYPTAMRGLVGLVNIGHEVTNVNILDDGIPVLTRDLPFGTRRLREDLQREHGLSASDAEELIRGYDRSPQLDSAVDHRTEEIATGIERAMAFLAPNLKKGETEIRSVYICGGGARTPGLGESLGRRTKKPVELANPLANIQVRDGALESLVTDEVAPLLMLSIGLALRQN